MVNVQNDKINHKMRLFFLMIIFIVKMSKESFGDVVVEVPVISYFFNNDSTFFLKVYNGVIYTKQDARIARKRSFRDISGDTVREGLAHAVGELYQKLEGDTLLVWRKKLLNPIAPVGVLVSLRGKYIVTFDDWHARGRGVHTMVLYDSSGSVLRHYSLDEISPVMPYKSVADWRKSAYIVGENILYMEVVDIDKHIYKRRYNMRTLEFEELVEPDIVK
jgi:hypothetical protein